MSLDLIRIRTYWCMSTKDNITMMKTRKTPQDVMGTLAKANNHEHLEVSVSEHRGKEIVRVIYADIRVSSATADRIMRELATKHAFNITCSRGDTQLYNVYPV